MYVYLRSAILGAALCLITVSVHAKPYFSSCAIKTGRSAGLIIPASAKPTINGAALSAGSEIAIYTPDGSCAGRGIWDEKSLAMAIWGNDVLTDEKDGLDTGDALLVQVWDAGSSKLYVGPELVQAELDTSEVYYHSAYTYAEGAIYRLTGLSIDTRLSPALVAPGDGGLFRDRQIDLTWRMVSGADSYNLLVATNSSFADPILDVTIDDTGASVDVDDQATYYWRVGARLENGTSWSETYSFTVDSGSKTGEIIGDFALEQNYPNPFNPSTTIPFELKHDAQVVLEVYNLLGQRVETLVDGPLSAGRHEVPWNARDLPSGMYVYRMMSGRTVQTKSLTLVK